MTVPIIDMLHDLLKIYDVLFYFLFCLFICKKLSLSEDSL